MFMVAPEPWLDGTNSKSDTTGEQLNTPGPDDVCGFEKGNFGGFAPAENNLCNVISKNNINSSSITMMNEEDHSNSNNNSSSMYGSKKEHLFEFKTSPMTPPSLTLDEAYTTAPFNCSWQFEPCPDDIMLSPEITYLTPHQSPGVASPDGSSGAAEYRETDEFETCVDFTFPHNTEVAEGTTALLSDEIEQLSESYYCKSNNLISVNNYTIDGDSSVSPSFLKVLQEESTVYDEPPPSVASNGIVFEVDPSIATILQSDAVHDDDDDDNNDDELEKPGKEAVAIAWTQEALQGVSSGDDTLDLKTQTQLEHNYTIKLPLDEGTPRHNLTTRNTVKEPLKPRETTLLQQPKRVQPGVKRQLFERKHSEMATKPKLKLSLPTEGAIIAAPIGVLNTPDLTNQVLELEAGVFNQDAPFDLVAFIDSVEDYDVVPTSPVDEKPQILVPAEPAPAPQSTICQATLSDLFNPGKRKLPIITIENIDELTASTNRKKPRFAAATWSTTSSLCGDNASETSSTPRAQKRRGRPPKQASSIRDRSEYQHLNEDDLRYREQRDKNNEASRRSRLNRRDREDRLEQEGDELKRQYEELKGEEQTLIQDCARWRRAVMRLALL